MTPPHETVPLLGAPVHRLDFEQTMLELERLAARGRATGRSHQVVTVNTDFLVNAHGDEAVLDVLQRADLALGDGMPVVWASRLMGAELPERVAGSDLVSALGAWSVEHGRRVMFFGGAGDSAATAASMVTAASPGADVVSATGMVEADGTAPAELLEAIRGADPDVLCVGLGHPKQEFFIRHHGADLRVPVAIGTGASFEFISGDQRRAPVWMQKSGLEWLHRMLNDPRRLVRRYGKDAVVFLPAIRRQVKLLRAGAPLVPERLELDDADRLDLTGVETLDAAAAVGLCTVATDARDRGARVTLTGVGAALRETLRALAIDGLFDIADG